MVAHNGSLRSNWLIWNLALNAAKNQPKPVLIWTQPWNPISVTSALMALHCGLPYQDLRHGCLTSSQWDVVSARLPSLERLPLHLVTENPRTAADLAVSIKKMAQEWGEPALVVVPELANLRCSERLYGQSACHHHAQQLLDAVQGSQTSLLVGCLTRASAMRSSAGEPLGYHDVAGWPEIISDASLILMPIWQQHWRNAIPEHFSQILLYGKGRHHADIYNCRVNEEGLYWEESDADA